MLRNLVLCGAILAMVYGLAQQAQRKPRDSAGAGVDVAMLQLLAPDEQTRDAGMKTIRDGRVRIIERLIVIIDPDNKAKYSEETRIVAAYLLGQFRAEEAVLALARALPDEPGVHENGFFHKNPYESPVWSALVEIGRASVPAMIEYVSVSDEAVIRQKSLGILWQVLGSKRHLVEALGKLKAKERDLARAKRLAAAITYVEEKYRETEEPLY